MKDRIIDCLAYDGKVSIKCISSTNLVEEAIVVLKQNKKAREYILSEELKNDEEILKLLE